MSWCPGGDSLDQDIFDAVTEFMGLLLKRGEQVAGQFDVPMFCVKALHRLETSVPLKEIGKRMHCDPSFVTMIADALEERGLAKREPSAADRRIKNLVLTDQGIEVKGSLERVLLSEMPWSHALDASERESFLALIRKMVGAMAAASPPPAVSQLAREVSEATRSASPAAS